MTSAQPPGKPERAALSKLRGTVAATYLPATPWPQKKQKKQGTKTPITVRPPAAAASDALRTTPQKFTLFFSHDTNSRRRVLHRNGWSATPASPYTHPHGTVPRRRNASRQRRSDQEPHLGTSSGNLNANAITNAHVSTRWQEERILPRAPCFPSCASASSTPTSGPPHDNRNPSLRVSRPQLHPQRYTLRLPLEVLGARPHVGPVVDLRAREYEEASSRGETGGGRRETAVGS